MRLTCFLLLCACMQVSANGYSQKVTLSVRNAPLSQVFNLIEKQTGYNFYYKVELLRNTGEVSAEVKKAPLEQVLQLIFKDQPLQYNIIENNIIVSLKQEPPVVYSVIPPSYTVSGKIVDADDGNPLPGASIIIKGTRTGTAANKDGVFVLKDVPAGAVLVISFTGYQPQEFKINQSINRIVHLL